MEASAFVFVGDTGTRVSVWNLHLPACDGRNPCADRTPRSDVGRGSASDRMSSWSLHGRLAFARPVVGNYGHELFARFTTASQTGSFTAISPASGTSLIGRNDPSARGSLRASNLQCRLYGDESEGSVGATRPGAVGHRAGRAALKQTLSSGAPSQPPAGKASGLLGTNLRCCHSEQSTPPRFNGAAQVKCRITDSADACESRCWNGLSSLSISRAHVSPARVPVPGA